MIQVVYGQHFLNSAKLLPPTQQKKLGRLLERLAENPYHSLLHTKHLSGDLAGMLSFRITRDWRVIFQFLGADTVQALRVVHRRDAYR